MDVKGLILGAPSILLKLSGSLYFLVKREIIDHPSRHCEIEGRAPLSSPNALGLLAMLSQLPQIKTLPARSLLEYREVLIESKLIPNGLPPGRDLRIEVAYLANTIYL
ncbi:MAG TPA: hypothetical protein VN455_02985 [Methanotrichaceae archaeon]|nr:hypothetical protein [Methanotrichaceae archaeon]